MMDLAWRSWEYAREWNHMVEEFCFAGGYNGGVGGGM